MKQQWCLLSVAKYVDKLAFFFFFMPLVLDILFLHILSVYHLPQLNNLELAVNLAKRGNLPGAENLVSLLFSYASAICLFLF